MSETDDGAPGAISQDDCGTCPTPDRSRTTGEIIHRLASRKCPHYWEHIAVESGAQLQRRNARIRELIRERETAKSATEAAYDMAEQYAREAGHDIGRHDVLRYVEDYWQQRGDFERTWTEMEAIRWELFQMKIQLEAGLERGRVKEIGAVQLATNVIGYLSSIAGSGTKRSVRLFARPVAPTGPQATLFEAAS